MRPSTLLCEEWELARIELLALLKKIPLLNLKPSEHGIRRVPNPNMIEIDSDLETSLIMIVPLRSDAAAFGAQNQ